MKYFFSFLFLALSISVSAQDIFKQELFSTDQVMKHSGEINLTDAQSDQVKKAHSAQIEAFNNTRWDLDKALHQLNQKLATPKVDEKEAMAQMDKVLGLEEDLKRMRLSLMIKIKNILTADQQAKLKEVRTDADSSGKTTFSISSVNDHPRMVLKIAGDREGKEEPLYVLFDKKGNKSIVTSITDISPNDIESINVLKGDSAFSSYGEEGKNGVVEIKLKK